MREYELFGCGLPRCVLCAFVVERTRNPLCALCLCGRNVEAAVTGSRKIYTEALILDGGVSDYPTATKLTDALIKAQLVHLPQFA
jgi:hypothetical protein